MKRIHLIISGKVQGVFFRANTNKIANKLNLKGFVRNMPDGAVELIAEGLEQQLDGLIEYCKNGPEGAMVENVKVKFEKAKNEFKDFEIRY